MSDYANYIGNRLMFGLWYLAGWRLIDPMQVNRWARNKAYRYYGECMRFKNKRPLNRSYSFKGKYMEYRVFWEKNHRKAMKPHYFRRKIK